MGFSYLQYRLHLEHFKQLHVDDHTTDHYTGHARAAGQDLGYHPAWGGVRGFYGGGEEEGDEP
jgi:hypothetical protein